MTTPTRPTSQDHQLPICPGTDGTGSSAEICNHQDQLPPAGIAVGSFGQSGRIMGCGNMALTVGSVLSGGVQEHPRTCPPTAGPH